ncbi:MAG: S-methyl-5-thioribose-1-phosphate isomerase, partial [Actinomycetota bacterium]
MRTLDWVDGAIELIDQTKLPQESEILRLETVSDLVAAIKRLSVRGAPALGVAGGYGVALAATIHDPTTDPDGFDAAVRSIREARPTAVNLARMVDRVAAMVAKDPAMAQTAALAEAGRIAEEELAASVAMGELGADLARELAVDRDG